MKKMIQRKNQIFSGTVVLTLEDAVRQMNINQNDMNTWVVKPLNEEHWEYVYENGKFSNASELTWKECVPMSLKTLNGLIYDTDVADKPYNHMSNNCQHFALNLFNKASNESKHFVSLMEHISK